MADHVPPPIIAPLPAANSPAAQPVAGTEIVTPADGLITAWTTLPAADGFALPAYVAKPIGAGPFPVVLVVQEIFGVHRHIADVARRLAQRGYVAVAPELFARQGDPRTVADVETLRRDFVGRTADAQVLSDLDATVAWVATQGGDIDRLGLTGFCWGGRIAWLYAAHQPRLKAVVAWYGRLNGDATALQPQHPINVVEQLAAPVLGLYGGQDQGIPLAAVEAQRQALQTAGKAGEIVVYPDAPHAFFADYRASYRPVAAHDGWERLLAWFASRGVR
jgi:carboxymethylenebutenolidase